jgi:tetratricopeptide (TPR) repeat protein
MPSHYWIRARYRHDRNRARQALDLPPLLAMIDAHRNLRGPYTAAGSLLRAIGEDALRRLPELGPRHHIEILTAAPEFAGQVPPIRRTLEEAGATGFRTRYFAQTHTARLAHGLAELVRDYCAALVGGPRTLVVENAHQADATDCLFIAVLLSRLAPDLLTIVVGTDSAELADPPGPVLRSMGQALVEHATAVDAAASLEPPSSVAPSEVERFARAFIDRDGTSDDPRHHAGYAQVPADQRAAWHDRRAELLAGLGEPSLLLGAVPYHAERGSDPAGAGAAAIREAQLRCKALGLYHATADLGARGSRLVDRSSAPKLWWELIGDVTTSLAVSGRPDEARTLLEELRTLTMDPEFHMHIAYAIGMLYARHYPDDRRDTGQARAWLNLAIALAEQLPDRKERAFWSVFNQNGLALVDVRDSRLDDALQRLETGIARLDRELEPTEQLLHRNGLRYNRAQAFMVGGRLEDALAGYTQAIDMDPNFPDNYFHRGNILARLGRHAEAVAEYGRAIALTPPMTEVYYNRADSRTELDDIDGALHDFGRVLELDPGHLDARVNRAGLLCDLGDHDAAASDVNAGLALDGSNARLWCLKARLLAERGDAAAATDAISTALAADGRLAEAYALRGTLAFDAGRLDASIEDLTRAVELDASPEIRFNRAVALQAAGRFTEAAQEYDAVLEHSDDTDARQRRDACLAAAHAPAGV